MAYRLALATGYANVDEMLEEMSGSQWGKWIAFFEEEPFGSVYEDVRTARLMALLANINRDPKKRAAPYEVDDFMPQLREPDPPSPEYVRQSMLLWAMSHNERLKQNKRAN